MNRVKGVLRDIDNLLIFLSCNGVLSVLLSKCVGSLDAERSMRRKVMRWKIGYLPNMIMMKI